MADEARSRLGRGLASLIGDVGGSFEYNRSTLLESVARRAQQVVAS